MDDEVLIDLKLPINFEALTADFLMIDAPRGLYRLPKAPAAWDLAMAWYKKGEPRLDNNQLMIAILNYSPKKRAVLVTFVDHDNSTSENTAFVHHELIKGHFGAGIIPLWVLEEAIHMAHKRLAEQLRKGIIIV